MTLHEIATKYVAAGLSVIPVRADGSKSPALAKGEVEQYRERFATADELAKWFRPGASVGVGIVCGAISGNLAVIDIESEAGWQSWRALVAEAGLSDWLAAAPVVKTPKGGRHVYVRVEESWVAGGKLAMLAKNVTLIEVRGQGHYVLAPGCPPACHERNVPYTVERAGWLKGSAPEQAQTSYERFVHLCDLARRLNEYTPPERTRSAAPAPSSAKGDRPGDDFNRRAEWADILGAHGWTVDHTSGAVTYWTRPGKDRGVSATTGKCRSDRGGDLFYVFSSNAAPFDQDSAYDKFGALAQLEFGGDFSAAGKKLRADGYGTPDKPSKPVVIRSTATVQEDGSRPTDPADCSAEPAGGRETPKPKFTFIDSADFLAGDYRQRFLIPRVLVANQPGVIAGPSKAMKTSVTVDMAVSLAAGAPFLGEFPVPHPVRVALVSGESGEATLQETVRRVLAARGLAGAALGDRLKLCFNLPQFPDIANMTEFAGGLLALGVEVVVIDPVYLCLGGDIDHANLFEMGAAFRVVADVLLKAGVTPLLVHHANRQLRTGDPMELTHLAYSGLEQFARQFVMINRQSAYRGDGVHDLWFSAGGSAGHGGLWSVHIEEGVVDEQFRGRSWGVTVQNPGEAQADRIGQKELKRREAERQKLRETEGMILDAIDKCGGTATARKMRDETGFRAAKVDDAIKGLMEDGLIEEVNHKTPIGSGAKRATKAYRRVSKTCQGTIGTEPRTNGPVPMVTDHRYTGTVHP